MSYVSVGFCLNKVKLRLSFKLEQALIKPNSHVLECCITQQKTTENCTSFNGNRASDVVTGFGVCAASTSFAHALKVTQ